MLEDKPGLRDLARQLLALEAEDTSDPMEVAKAVDTACQKLQHQLVHLIGPGAFQAVFARALHLAEEEFPFLIGIELSPRGCLQLEGLLERVRGLEHGLVEDAFTL